MRFKGFDGREYTLSPKDYFVYGLDMRNRSEDHLRARALLHKVFPNDRILEEVSLVGSKTAFNGTLFADFLIPTQSLMVEVHGRQHYEYTPFFHNSVAEFNASKARDNKKLEWCQINGIILLTFPYGETNEQWKERIERRFVCE